MSQPIPPLLCNTPPPIDFNDYSDDDCADFEMTKMEYEGILIDTSPQNNISETDDSSNLPPLPTNLEHSSHLDENNSFVFKSVEITNDGDQHFPVRVGSSLSFVEEVIEGKKCFDVELQHELVKIDSTIDEIIQKKQQGEQEVPLEYAENISREDSPQSLELCTANLSDGDNDSEIEFPSMNYLKTDDNISLPSLKFDSVEISKNTTPVFGGRDILSKDSDGTTSKTDNSIFCALSSLPKQENLDDSCIEMPNTIIFTSELEKENHTYLNNDSQYIKDFSEDSSITEKTEFESKTNSSLILSKPSLHEHDSKSQMQKQFSNKTNLEFDADFSKLDIAESCNFYSRPKGNKIETERMNSKEFEIIEKNAEIDDFEEFQDFESQIKVDFHGDFAESNLEKPYSNFNITIDCNLISLRKKIETVLYVMFPKSNENNSSLNYENDSSMYILKNQMMSNLVKTDSTNALNFLWFNSNIKQSLIKSLGMDSRNILYGEKWNNSFPRFAANLVLNPLEPLKPAKNGNNLISSLTIQESRETKERPEIQREVPDAEFDWQSSALINPLDGNKWSMHGESIHGDKIEIDLLKLESVQKSLESQISNNGSKSINVAIDGDVYARISTTLGEKNEKGIKVKEEQCSYQENDKFSSDEKKSYSIISTFPLPLKETHIFTPSKVELNTLENFQSNNDDSIDFDYKMAAAGIVIDEKVVKKEYRDLEYNPMNWRLEKNMDICKSLNEFQTDSSLCTLREKLPIIRTEINSDSTETNSAIKLAEHNGRDTFTDMSNIKLTASETNPHLDSESVSGNFQFSCHPLPAALPVISNIAKVTTNSNVRNESDNMVDKNNDEFTDFQYVSPPVFNPMANSKDSIGKKSKNYIETPTLGEEMILSPAVFLPNTFKVDSSPLIEWPEPGISSEELARIEELFPQSKNKGIKKDNALSQFNINEDDDWSDFVSMPAINKTTSLTQALSLGINSGEETAKAQNNDEDWSDFVSGVPVQCSCTQTRRHLNIWYEPTARNSLNICDFHQNQELQSKNYVPNELFQGSNTTNLSHYLLQNNSIISDHQINHHLPTLQGQPQQSDVLLNRQSQLNQAPDISLIPDLGFLAPKCLINVRRPTISKK